ncbi:hypothetical protein Tco_0092316 [Tanacetum coccineum]
MLLTRLSVLKTCFAASIGPPYLTAVVTAAPDSAITPESALEPWACNLNPRITEDYTAYRYIEDDGSVGVKSSNADDLSTVETLSAEKVKLLLAEATLAGKSYEENGSEIADASEDDVEPFELNTTEVVITNGKSGSSESKSKSKTTADKKAKENGSSVTTDSSSHHSGRKGHDYSSKKGVKAGRTVGENEPSKFRDPLGDASLDDLFQPNDKLDDRSAEA